MSGIDHEFTDELVCPWCGYELCDSWERTNDEGEEYCDRCGNMFTYTRHITVEYSTEKKEAASE